MTSLKKATEKQTAKNMWSKEVHHLQEFNFFFQIIHLKALSTAIIEYLFGLQSGKMVVGASIIWMNSPVQPEIAI